MATFTGGGAASSTRYYLSTNTVRDAADILLSGVRAVPALGAGAASVACANSPLYCFINCGSTSSSLKDSPCLYDDSNLDFPSFFLHCFKISSKAISSGS